MAGQLVQILTFALIGFCLILIVEGLVYALFPDKMKVLHFHANVIFCACVSWCCPGGALFQP